MKANGWFRKGIGARLAVALLLPLVNTAAAESSSITPADQLPAALQGVTIEQKLDEAVPLDIEFRDEHGRSVRLGDYFGQKPVVLALVYYECPMLCGMELNGLLRAARVLSLDIGKDYEVVTVSFDPDETPELAAAKKREYVGKYNRPEAETSWHFLTGGQKSIERLTEAVGFRYTYDPETDLFNHASGIMVLTPEGRLSHYFYGVEYPPRDLRLGLIEASQNKIGSPVDQVLLYCFHYDPVTGKYGLVIMNVIRLAGVATVLALGAFMLLMLRRERRQRLVVVGGDRL